MVIYDLTITVDPFIEGEYLKWLRPHMNEVVNVGGFTSADLLKVEDQPSTYVVRYMIESRTKLDLYFKEHASKLRSGAKELFGDKFKIERRVLVGV